MRIERKHLANFIIFVMIVVVSFMCLGVNNIDSQNYGRNIAITNNELNEIKPPFPLEVNIEKKTDKTNLVYSFARLPLRSIDVDVTPDRKVYLGGQPLGISMSVGGLIVSDVRAVVTDSGVINPFNGKDLQVGDLLTHVNGQKVGSYEDISKILDTSEGAVFISLRRGEREIHYSVMPALDIMSGSRKLGLWLRSDIDGIGTMTYIDINSKRYGALGHIIKDVESGVAYTNPDGDIYNANIFGVVKGEKGKAGELSGTFAKSNSVGSIDKNCDYGIFGNYSGDINNCEEITLCSRANVRMGKAYIYTTVNGNVPKKYEIEIVKTNHQDSAKVKGMLIRVTDKELLSITGGIVQGMSGSPIVQNGKLVGAVTHVFINDPTKGYGTYIDWMLPN